jgi:hypothetical protein
MRRIPSFAIGGPPRPAKETSPSMRRFSVRIRVAAMATPEGSPALRKIRCMEAVPIYRSRARPVRTNSANELTNAMGME